VKIQNNGLKKNLLLTN